MEPLLIVIIIVLLVVLSVKIFLKPDFADEPKLQDKNEVVKYPYKQKMLLTKTEYTFYRVLKEECDKRQYLICPKVRMEDFLEVTCDNEKLKYRGYIKSRHVDFMICNSKLHILCGIELDDSSHNNAKAQQSDAFKNQVFSQIKIPLHRIKVGKENYSERLNTILDSINSPLQEDK